MIASSVRKAVRSGRFCTEPAIIASVAVGWVAA